MMPDRLNSQQIEDLAHFVAVLTPDQPDYLAWQDAETDAAIDLIYVRSSSGATPADIAEMRLRLTERRIERLTGRNLPRNWPEREAVEGDGDGEC